MIVVEKSYSLNDTIIKTDGLGHLFQNVRKTSAKAVKDLATNRMETTRIGLEIGAEIGLTAVSRNTKALSSIFLVVKEALSYR